MKLQRASASTNTIREHPNVTTKMSFLYIYTVMTTPGRMVSFESTDTELADLANSGRKYVSMA